MSSTLWTRVGRVVSTRAVRSVPAPRHSFFTLSSKQHNVPPKAFAYSRAESTSAAPASDDAPFSVTPIKAEPILPLFSTLAENISPETLRAITVKPFQLTRMSAVQAEVLPLLPALAEPYDPTPLPDGQQPPLRDLLVRAKTGTGKTLAFLVPAIEARIKAIRQHVQQALKDSGLTADKHLADRAQKVFVRSSVGALIISPTRELATQIANEALRLTLHHDDFEVRLFTGGTSKRMQMRDWMKGRRDIVVATPGRLRDLLTSEPEVVRGLSKTQILILDEADTLLDMGFREDIEAIKKFLPPVPERQTFLFSATVSKSIQEIARSTLARNHKYINCVSDDSSPVHAHVNQYHTVLPSAGHQVPHTLRLLAHDQLINPGNSKIVLFLPTTKMTQLFATLIRELSKTTLPAGRNTHVYEIHSKRTQDARTSTSEAFRKDKSGASILVTSDVSARGVDYPGVTRVVQIGIPGGTEQYVHRVGRTGRAGTKGRGDLVLLPWEIGFVTWQLTHVPLKPLTVNELTAQLKTLSEEFDQDPAEYFKKSSAPTAAESSGPRGRITSVSGPAMFASQVTPVLNQMEEKIQDLLEKIDEEAVKETFASLLGYYMAKSPELRVQKGVIVEGCKTWSVEACGLPTPPYVSESFLQKLGFSDGRTKNWGRQREMDAPQRMNRWDGRGRQSSRDQVTPSWARSSNTSDPNDPADPDEYRSARYGAKAPTQGYQGGFARSEESSGYSGGKSSGGGRGYGLGGAPASSARSSSYGGGGGGYNSGRGGVGGGFGGSRSGGGGGGYGGGRDGGESGYGMRR